MKIEWIEAGADLAGLDMNEVLEAGVIGFLRTQRAADAAHPDGAVEYQPLTEAGALFNRLKNLPPRASCGGSLNALLWALADTMLE